MKNSISISSFLISFVVCFIGFSVIGIRNVETLLLDSLLASVILGGVYLYGYNQGIKDKIKK